MTWQAISWSELRFVACILTEVRSTGSHPPFHMTCLQVKHCECPEVQTDPFTSRLGNIPTPRLSFLTTNRARTMELVFKGPQEQRWMEHIWCDMAGKDCESNCKTCALAEKNGIEKKEEEEREEEEESNGWWNNPYLLLPLQPPFYLLCLLSSNVNAPSISTLPHHKYILSYTSIWYRCHPAQIDSLLKKHISVEVSEYVHHYMLSQQ